MFLDYRRYLDLIFPPSKDELMVRQTDSDTFLKNYQLINDGDFTSLSSFKNETVRAAIHLVKYHHHPKATALLASLLHQFLAADTNLTILIPVPLSQKRYRTRGYNQVEVVARLAAAELSHVTVETELLKRVKDTTPQTTLKRNERLKNMTGAFKMVQDFNFLNKQVIILDDVATTGATLKAAKASLWPPPANLTCLALAH